jgi:ankyrin repeat protein
MNKLYKQLKDKTLDELNDLLIDAAIAGDYEAAEYITSSPELEIHADVQFKQGQALTQACKYGHLDIVEYLLTSPLLKTHPHINEDHGSALYYACNTGQLNIVQYLLTSPNLKEHADIHISGDHIFRDLCTNEEYDILNFLIFDYNMQKTDAIEKFLNVDQSDGSKFSIAMFLKRDFMVSLERELSSSNEKDKKKPKI